MEFFSRIIYKWVDFPASLGLLGLIIGGQTACGGTMNVGQRKPFSCRVDPIVPEMEGTDSPKTAIWCYNVGVRKPWDSGLLVSGSHAQRWTNRRSNIHGFFIDTTGIQLESSTTGAQRCFNVFLLDLYLWDVKLQVWWSSIFDETYCHTQIGGGDQMAARKRRVQNLGFDIKWGVRESIWVHFWVNSRVGVLCEHVWSLLSGFEVKKNTQNVAFPQGHFLKASNLSMKLVCFSSLKPKGDQLNICRFSNLFKRWCSAEIVPMEVKNRTGNPPFSRHSPFWSG